MPENSVSAAATPQVATASDFKRAQGQIILLPSGKWVRVQRTMSLMNMMKTGTIPNPLSGYINKMLADAGTNPQAVPKLDLNDLDPEAVAQLLVMIDEQVCYMFLEPRVLPLPEIDPVTGVPPTPDWWPEDDGSNQMPVTALDLVDKMFVFQFGQGGPAELERFLESADPADAVGNEPEVGNSPEQPAGDS
jgi:hypothetical protein